MVGQGIAGSLAAWALVENGHRVLVVDDAGASSGSSRAAAGLLNPVTGKRMVIPALWEKFRATAGETYRAMGQALGAELFSELPIIRIPLSQSEAEGWQARRGLPDYGGLIESGPTGQPPATGIKSPFDWFRLPGARVDLVRLLELVRGWLARNEALVAEHFDERDLQVRKSGYCWKGRAFRAVVLCQGAAGTTSSFFDNQPFNPVKGESLLLSAPGLPETAAFAGRIHLVPVGPGTFWAGGTYDRKRLDENPSREGRRALEQGIRELTDLPFEVQAHLAAIRPTTHTREPLLEEHPMLAGLFRFNGLGSKGALRGPWLAHELARMIGSFR